MAPKTLKETAQKSNPSQLGDPVSLKAETSDSEPTEHDRGAAQTQPQTSSNDDSKKSLKQIAESNPTLLGDPVSLKAEKTDAKTDPVDHDNGPSGKRSTPRSKL